MSAAGKAGALALLAFAALAPQGCSGLPDTADQVLTVSVEPAVQSAHCVVTDANGAWTVWYVPGTISILRDSKTLTVECKAPGGWAGSLALASQADPMAAFTGQGSRVEARASTAPAPGARYDGNTTNKWNGTFRTYPGVIVVPMRRVPG